MADGDKDASKTLEEAGRHILAHLPLSMVLTDPNLDDNPIVYVNRSFEKTTGYAASFAVGRNCRFLQGPETNEQAVARLREGITAREPVAVDILNDRLDGSPFMNRLMVAPVFDDAGGLFSFVGVQMQLAASGASPEFVVDRMEGVLRETQHRVKNHLQMVASMIRLQSRSTDPAQTYDLLARRVEALSLLYDEFSTTVSDTEPRYDVVSAGGYVSRVTTTIGALDGRKAIRMNVDTDPVYMRTDRAAQLGLLTSEILSNTLQHAFEGRNEGVVEVRLKEHGQNRIRLTVSDDGIGMEGTQWPTEGNLGARIASGIVKQLGAKLNLTTSEAGTIISVDLRNDIASALEAGGERVQVTAASDGLKPGRAGLPGDQDRN